MVKWRGTPTVMNGTKKRLSDDRQPRCITCRHMLYLTPEGECQNCRYLATVAAVRERRRRLKYCDDEASLDEDDEPVL